MKKVKKAKTIFRTSGEHEFFLCDHISINVVRYDDGGCEYEQEIEIFCNVCKKVHYVVLAIN